MREFISNSIPCQNSYVAFRPFAGTDPTICTTATDKEVANRLFDQFFNTITEDEETLEAQQMRINDDPFRKFVGIASDGAVNQARRVLSTMFEAENNEIVAAE